MLQITMRHHGHAKKPKHGQAVMLPEAANAARDKISENVVEKEQQVLRFDAVWAAIKSSFVHHPNDYKKLFTQYEEIYKGYQVQLKPDEFQVYIENFIKMFSEARGGRMDRSLLFSKEFVEAMKLHLSDPENSKALLFSLKRSKPYNPAELCKAYNACMRDIEEIRIAMSEEKIATINHKILGFISKVSIDITGAKRIDNHLLDSLRDKMVPGSPFITSHKKRTDSEFAKEFGTHFPVLKNILEKVVIDQHPKEYAHSKDKQKYLDSEMRKMVKKIASNLQADAKKAKINVHHKFVELEKENDQLIKNKAIGNGLKLVLAAVQSKKQSIKVANIIEKAYQEDYYLEYIKKNCPSLHKKIDSMLKTIKDPIIYSAQVAIACQAIMEAGDANTALTEVDSALKLSSELGVKIGLPLKPPFAIESDINPEFISEALTYNKQKLVDEMCKKYPNIIQAIVRASRDESVKANQAGVLEFKKGEEYDYDKYIDHINAFKNTLETALPGQGVLVLAQLNEELADHTKDISAELIKGIGEKHIGGLAGKSMPAAVQAR